MNKLSALLIASSLISMVSCSKSEDTVTTDKNEGSTPVEEKTPEEKIEENLGVLTSGKTKTWKISNAVLVNSKGRIDISDNFNVADDEFVFTFGSPTSKDDAEGCMEWRQGNSVETEAGTPEESEEDFYRAPLKFNFTVGENPNDIVITGNEDKFKFEDAKIVTDADGESSFSTSIVSADGATIEVASLEKKQEDFIKIPSGVVSFSNAFDFKSSSIDCCSPGMVGSYSDNSFFIVTRENDSDNIENHGEHILKFDFDTGSVKEKLYIQSDFVTKQVHIIDNKLRVVGGKGINTYGLDIEADPTRDEHGLSISRSGTAVLDNEIYVVGGDVFNAVADKIFKWNEITKTLEEVATMPEARSGARSEIINNKLYIFGGTEELFTPPAKNTIYVYDFVTETLTTEFLPNPLYVSYTGKFENLIYVGGQVRTWETDEDGVNVVKDNEPFLGVYDTNTGEFTELETDLASPGQETIHGMAVFNKKIFIIYGAFDNTLEEGERQTWDVLVSDL